MRAESLTRSLLLFGSRGFGSRGVGRLGLVSRLGFPLGRLLLSSRRTFGGSRVRGGTAATSDRENANRNQSEQLGNRHISDSSCRPTTCVGLERGDQTLDY